MNPAEDVLRFYQDLVNAVPEVLQPVIVALAAMVPYLEAEGASPIGVFGGIHPIVAGVSAAAGNFAVVTGIVTLGSRVREAVVARRRRRRADAGEPEAKAPSKGRIRFRRFLVRFGVPGASLLGPLVLPTHLTSAMLVASGTPRRWVLLWQGVAIVVWTTLTTTAAWAVTTAVLG